MSQFFSSMGDLNSLMGGAVNERWQDALTELTQNVLDPNTDPKRARKIVLELTVKPNERRDGGEMAFNIKKSFAPPTAVTQTVFFGMDDKGMMHATQKLDQIPGQVNMVTGEITPQPVSMPLGKVEQEEDEEGEPNVLSFK